MSRWEKNNSFNVTGQIFKELSGRAQLFNTLVDRFLHIESHSFAFLTLKGIFLHLGELRWKLAEDEYVL